MVWPMSRLTEQLADLIAPLGEDEQRRAVEAANAFLGESRLRLHGAELVVDKRLPGSPVRQITVWLTDDGGSVHEVVVDGDGVVVDASSHDDLVLPFRAEEIEKAVAIAEASQQVASVAQDRNVARASFYPTHAAEIHRSTRRIGLHYFDATDRASLRPLLSVVVDLGAG
jgi:hypothetical protein